jgi:hypothetical protein
VTTTQARIRCEVPGCRRTRVPNASWPVDGQWWLCAVHWPRVSAGVKRVLARYRRQERKFGQQARPAAYSRICQRAFREAGVFDHDPRRRIPAEGDRP